ncbi:MAG: acetyltransferase [Candidatus Latescibacteria bacterium]|nr:acetyltransferase [Candidatus Latescibacterota bacterium]
MQKLVFLGIGSNNSDILDAVQEINALKPTYEVLGYVTRNGTPVNKGGLKHLGDFDTVRALPEDVQITGFSFGPGSYQTWPGTVAELSLPRERFATIIHPHAFVSRQSTVGPGSVILAGTTVGAFVTIGDHVIILQNVGLSHDDVIEDYSCLAVGVSFSGSVRVGRNCFLGTNSTIIGARIGEGSMVGAGTLILRDVPAGEVWVGNPGRFLRRV